MINAVQITRANSVGASFSLPSSTTTGGTGSIGVVFVTAPSFVSEVVGVTDNKGNAWLDLGSEVGADSKQSIWYCPNWVGGTAHVVSISYGPISDLWASAHLIEVTGAASSGALDVETFAVDNATPWTVSSGTLAQANEVLLVGASANSEPDGSYASSNFEIISAEDDWANWYTSAVGKLNVTSTSSVTPSVTKGAVAAGLLRLLSFKAARDDTGVALSYSNAGASANSYALIPRTALTYSNPGTGTNAYALSARTALSYSNTGIGSQAYSPSRSIALAYANSGAASQSYALSARTALSYTNAGTSTNAYSLELRDGLSYFNVGTGTNTYALTAYETPVLPVTGGGGGYPFEIRLVERPGEEEREAVLEVPVEQPPKPEAPAIVVEPSQAALDAIEAALKPKAEVLDLSAERALLKELERQRFEQGRQLALQREEEEAAVLMLMLNHRRKRKLFG